MESSLLKKLNKVYDGLILKVVYSKYDEEFNNWGFHDSSYPKVMIFKPPDLLKLIMTATTLKKKSLFKSNH